MTLLPTVHTAHHFLSETKWSNLQYDGFGYLLDKLSSEHLPDKLWLVIPCEQDIPTLMECLQFWMSKHRNILYYPADDSDSLDGISPARAIPQRRLLTLQHWYDPEPCLVLSSTFGLMHQNISKEDFANILVSLTVESTYDIQSLSETFQNMGYLVNRELDCPGMFKLLGDTIHIWPIGETEPVRLSFFDDELEHIHRFVDDTRLSQDTIAILPARELVLHPKQFRNLKTGMMQFVRRNERGRETFRQITGNLQDGIWFPGAEDYLAYAFDLVSPVQEQPAQSLIVYHPQECLTQCRQWNERIQNRWRLLNPDQQPLIHKETRFTGQKAIEEKIQQAWHISEENIGGALFTLQPTTPYQTPQHNLEPLIKQLNRWCKLGFKVAFVARTHNRIERLNAMFRSHGVEHQMVDSLDSIESGHIGICLGKIDTGFIDPDAKVSVLCLEYIFKMSTQTVQMPTTLKEAIISNIAEIKPGDIVVHRDNGIGQFVGIVQRNVQETLIDCIQIEYANNVLFYMPVDKIEDLYRYRSMGSTPKLDKLGSPSWAKRFRKVRHSVGAMAEELIKQTIFFNNFIFK